MSKKIVVVEDDLFSQDFYKLFFKKIGMEVFILESFDSIITTIENHQIDLIIMDINIKNTFYNSVRLDGLGLSKIIKSRYGSLNIPILLITAYPISTFGENVLDECMADDYFTKPIYDYNLLVEKINKLIYSKNERQSTYS
jgi:two-component system torCAD operon response regulator TorR